MGTQPNRTVVGRGYGEASVFTCIGWIRRRGEVVDLQLTRAKFLKHFAGRAPCVVAMEACGGSQHWARALRALGHEARLLPAKAVRPFVGRQQETMPTMRGRSGRPCRCRA